jgi:hypothetical protein
MPIGGYNKRTKTITTVKQQASMFKYLDGVYDCVELNMNMQRRRHK